MMVSISRREWQGVIFFTFGVLLLTSIPYLVGWSRQGSDWVFMGALFGVEDSNAYLGKMRLGARGLWEFHLFYTPEDHQSEALLYLPYIIPGQIVGLLWDDPELFSALIITFQILRLLLDGIVILVTYRFIAVFLPKVTWRFLALFLATFGGGLGWLLLLTGNAHWFGTLPLEFYVPEGFSFLVLLGLPHIALARAALLGGFLLIFKALQNSAWVKQAILAGICWLLVGLCVSFYFVILYAAIAAWGLAVWFQQKTFPRQFAIRVGIAVSLTFPLFGYYLLIFSQNDAFATWSSQNLLNSPHPLHYLSAYGLLAIFAYRGGRWAWNRHQPPYLLLIAWVLIVPILVYLPINIQRRMAESVLVPLVILAVVGLKSVQRHLQIVMIVTLSFSSLVFWFIVLFSVLTPKSPLFRSEDELAAMDWLAQHASDETRILADPTTGNLLPVRTNLRPFVGHDVETIDSAEKKRQIKILLENPSQSLYSEFDIQYVFYGPHERDLVPTFSPPWALIYDRNGYQIYRVVH